MPGDGAVSGTAQSPNCRDSGAAADGRGTRWPLPRAASRAAQSSAFPRGFQFPLAPSEAHAASRPVPSSRSWRFQDHEATHLLHLGSRDSLWRVTAGSCGRSSSWETAETLTGLDAMSGSSNGASRLSGRPGGRPAHRRPAPALRGEIAGPRRRPAGGAAGRSLRKAGPDPQVVLGDLPAPRLGAGQGRSLRSVCRAARRAARRGPGCPYAHPPRLAGAAGPARAASRGRPSL